MGKYNANRFCDCDDLFLALSCQLSQWHWTSERPPLMSRVASSALTLYSRHSPKRVYIKFISQIDL